MGSVLSLECISLEAQACSPQALFQCVGRCPEFRRSLERCADAASIWRLFDEHLRW